MLKIEPTFIKDLYVLHRHVHQDERGIFNRFFAADELAAAGIPAEAVHINSSTSTSMEPCEAFIFNTLLSPKERSFPVPRVRFGTWALIFAWIPLPGSSGLEPSSLQRMESAWLFPKALAMLSSRLNPTQPSCMRGLRCICPGSRIGHYV